MISNSAQTFTLPLHLFDCYKSYKVATNEVIRWLTRSSEHGIERANLTSVRELRYLADYIMFNKIEIPSRLLHISRRAVQARHRITNYYKQSLGDSDLETTESHQFFNNTLEEVLDDLDHYHKQSRVIAFDVVVDMPRADINHANPFQCLEGHAELAKLHTPRSTPTVQDTNVLPIKPTANQEPSGPSIADDCLEELTSIHEYLLLDRLTVTTKNSFKNCESGRIPLLVAAMTAECAYQCGKSLSSTLHHYDLHNPAELKNRQDTLLENLGIGKQLAHDQNHQRAPSNVQMLDLDELQLVWQELSGFKEVKRSENCQLSHTRCINCGIVPHKSIFEDPMHYFETRKAEQERVECGDTMNRQFYRSLLRALSHQIQYTSGSSSRALLQASLIDDFRVFITEEDVISPPHFGHLSICFGLYLFKKTFQGFYEQTLVKGQLNFDIAESLSQPKYAMGRFPRLYALKLSSDLNKATKSTLESPNAPCSCMQIRGSMLLTNLAETTNVFGDFVRTVNFDLLHQNPWISGVHAAHNLAQASECGSMLWHYGYFVGTVLHVYNALVQSKLLEPCCMSVLDALCNIYKDSLFLGKRSTHNVHSCWQRWTGAKIMPKHHRDQIQTDAIEKKWHLCAVHDKSHGGDTESRSFAPDKVSLFSLLAKGTSVLEEDIITCIYLARQKFRKYQQKDARAASNLMDKDGCLALYVEKVQAALVKEFQDDIVPVARINHFAVYHACMRVMRKISEANHDVDPGYICKCAAELCLKECEVYLKSCSTRTGRRRSQIEYRKACDSCLEYLREEFAEQGVDEFLWDVSLRCKTC